MTVKMVLRWGGKFFQSRPNTVFKLIRGSHPFFASGVSGEVINWHFDAFSLLQLSQDVDQQLKVEGIGVIEVVLIFSCQLLLFFVQHLNDKEI